MSYYTYIHVKPDGTPFYVGKGRRDRLIKIDRPHNQIHGRILAKYGMENIYVVFMECSSDDYAISLEIGLIKRMRCMGIDLCNMTDGGDGTSGFKRSEDQCAANGLRKIGNKNMKGKKHSEETKQTMRKKSRLRWSSAEERRKQSERLSGKTASKKSREKMSAAKIGSFWITNGNENKQVKEESEIPHGWRRGRIIKTPYKRRKAA